MDNETLSDREFAIMHDYDRVLVHMAQEAAKQVGRVLRHCRILLPRNEYEWIVNHISYCPTTSARLVLQLSGRREEVQDSSPGENTIVIFSKEEKNESGDITGFVCLRLADNLYAKFHYGF